MKNIFVIPSLLMLIFSCINLAAQNNPKWKTITEHKVKNKKVSSSSSFNYQIAVLDESVMNEGINILHVGKLDTVYYSYRGGKTSLWRINQQKIPTHRGRRFADPTQIPPASIYCYTGISLCVCSGDDSCNIMVSKLCAHNNGVVRGSCLGDECACIIE